RRQRDAELVEFLQLRVDLRDMQQRLRGDAADIEAGTANVLLLHDADMRAKLRRANGGHVATDARADHENVELSLFVRHCSLLRRVCGVCTFVSIAFASIARSRAPRSPHCVRVSAGVYL